MKVIYCIRLSFVHSAISPNSKPARAREPSEHHHLNNETMMLDIELFTDSIRPEPSKKSDIEWCVIHGGGKQQPVSEEWQGLWHGQVTPKIAKRTKRPGVVLQQQQAPSRVKNRTTIRSSRDGYEEDESESSSDSDDDDTVDGPQAAINKRNDKIWRRMLRRLLKYKRQYGTLRVNKALDSRLYEWTKSQRRMYRNNIHYSGHNKKASVPKPSGGYLRQDRFEQLESIGFPWSLVKSGDT
jgi:hypothetical protein